MDIWLQLGVAGAALFLLYTFINKLFSYLDNRNKSDNKSGDKVDKLCDKIDKLVESNHALTTEITKQSLAASKDNESINGLLTKILEFIADIQRRVVKVDERTRQCLKKDGE